MKDESKVEIPQIHYEAQSSGFAKEIGENKKFDTADSKWKQIVDDLRHKGVQVFSGDSGIDREISSIFEAVKNGKAKIVESYTGSVVNSSNSKYE